MNSLISQASVRKPSHNMQAVFGRQKGGQGHGPRRSMRRKWTLQMRMRPCVISLRELRNIQNAVCSKVGLGKNQA